MLPRLYLYIPFRKAYGPQLFKIYIEEKLEVPDIMKQMTKRMVPNPIKYPIDRYEAAKILKAALYQVFTEVMRHYYITEHPTLDYIFDYILSQEIPRMVNCFGEEDERFITRL